jgi:hypothetical protein
MRAEQSRPGGEELMKWLILLAATVALLVWLLCKPGISSALIFAQTLIGPML